MLRLEGAGDDVVDTGGNLYFQLAVTGSAGGGGGEDVVNMIPCTGHAGAHLSREW